MYPTITYTAGLFDVDPAAPALGMVRYYDGDVWTAVPVSEILSDTLDDVANRGAVTDKVLTVGGLKAVGEMTVIAGGKIRLVPGNGIIDCQLGTLTGVVAQMYDSIPDAAAEPFDLYHSADADKLSYKDRAGTVHRLYS